MVMAYQMDSGEYSHGTVVALEGDDNLIGTQLRLLPISSKILIINSLLDSIPQFSTTDAFDARLFVRHVHRAFSHRSKTARSFLQSSTSDQPRLVFMNGGSIGARATCLTKICEKVTNGDLQQAELIFEDIVKGGVTGLMTPSQTPEEIEDNEIYWDDNKRLQVPVGGQIIEKQRISEDPSVIAMRAAESLDRATASLEPSVDIGAMNEAPTFRTTWRSSVMEIQSDLIRRTSSNKRHSDSISELSRGFSLARSSFGDKRRARKPSSLDTSIFSIDLEHSIFDAVQSTLSPIRPETKRGTFGPPSIASDTYMTRYSEATTASESFRDFSNLQQPESVEGVSSIPPTPVILGFGDARAVDLRSSQSSSHINSVDGFSMVSSRLQATMISPSQRKKHNRSSFCFGNRSPSLAVFPRPESLGSFRSQPEPATDEISKTAISRSIVEDDMAPKNSVGRGTNLIRWDDECLSLAHKNQRPDGETRLAPLQPVFPAVEDLIIHLDDGRKNDILQAVINGYKNGEYPPHASPKPSQHYTPSPVSPLYNTSKSVNHSAFPTMTTPNLENKVPRNKETPDSYQTLHQRVYAPESKMDSTQGTPIPPQPSRPSPSPPTPATIPPSTINTNPAGKLRDFKSINENAVKMQSSLRTTLNGRPNPKGRPPPGGYPRQKSSSFKDNEFRKSASRKDDAGIPMVDQIISLGCDEGVSKDLVDDLIAKIEGLGVRPNCENQVGRLDIRKLVASAMQTFTSLPLTSQTSNPFKRPRHLAVLLIPHLEKYLSKNPSIRFLVLTFDMNYLSTMLAMRTHIGVEILKVCVVVIPAKFPPRSSSCPIALPGADIRGNESTLTLGSRPGTPHPGQASSPHINFAPTRANIPKKESTYTLRSQPSTPQLGGPGKASSPYISFAPTRANIPRKTSTYTLRSQPSTPQLAQLGQASPYISFGAPRANLPKKKKSTFTLRSQPSTPHLGGQSPSLLLRSHPGLSIPRKSSTPTLRSRASVAHLARPSHATGPLADSPSPQSLAEAANQHGPVDFMLIAPAPHDEPEQRETSMEFFLADILTSLEQADYYAAPAPLPAGFPRDADDDGATPAQLRVKKRLAEPYIGVGEGITAMRLVGITPPPGYGVVASEDEEDVEERERKSGDALEKMFMPRYRAITDAEKKNNGKAMKTLGLA